MRLARPPDEATLARLYYELGRLGARTVGRHTEWQYGSPSAEELVVLASQAARYDPRALWILVELVTNNLTALNPVKLRAALRNSRWPAALGVVFEFARRVTQDPELDNFHRFVMRGSPRAQGEQFFLSTHSFAGAMARRDAEESLAEYKRWGFLSREEPFAKELGTRAHGTLARQERLNLLRRLVERLGSISLADYRDALGHKASSRQASRDLAIAPFLIRTGATRGARYSLKPQAPPQRHLAVGQAVRVRVSGRQLNGIVVADRGRAGSQRSHQLVRVKVQDPLNPRDRYEVEIPADWASAS
jgi:hypothetical protein